MNQCKCASLAAALLLASALTLSCSSDDGGTPSPEVGSGGSVAIGEQTWMGKNLDVAAEGSKCYDDDPENCEKYGRLYDWATAMALDPSCNSVSCAGQVQAKHRGLCPAGWHIPTDADWDALMTAVGGSSTAGTKLKSASGWGSGGVVGTDEYNFSALPGGYGYSSGNFYDAGS